MLVALRVSSKGRALNDLQSENMDSMLVTADVSSVGIAIRLLQPENIPLVERDDDVSSDKTEISEVHSLNILEQLDILLLPMQEK